MFKLPIKLKVHYLIIPLLVTFLLYIFSLIFLFFPYIEKNIVDKRKEMIKELTYTVWNIIDYYDKQVEDSVLSLDDAKSIVLNTLRDLKYGKEKKDYFWINDYRPYMIMHPYLPELNNKNLADYTDPDGTYLFNEMVEIVLRNGEGFVNYKWQLKDDTLQILPKISFVKGYKKWGWIIGTGVYINDIEDELALMEKQLISGAFIITLLVFLLYFYILRTGIKKEKHLVEIELKYKKLFEEANDAILLMHNFKYVDCNSKTLKLFNCTEKDLIGAIVKDFSPEFQDNGENSDIASRKIIENCIKGKSQFFEWKHLTKDRKAFIAEVSLSSIEIKDEIYVLSFVRDITKRKNDELKLVKAMEKAEASDKLKSAFLANMSHEVRTPMNGILGFSHLIQDNDLSPEKRNEYLKIILNKGNQLMQIINDIIDISKIESNQISINQTNFSLNDLIDELSAFFSIEFNNLELRINKSLNKYNDYITSDQTRLIQILTNLLSNAFKFTESGFIELGYEIKNSDLYFYVKDTGIGVKKEDQKIIFDRFRQSDDSTTRKYGGTGLGLSISKGLVELLGGKINVESDGKNGSLFYFTIPYRRAEAKSLKSKVGFENNLNWDTKKIMVVEDDDISFQYIFELLKETNVELFHVKTGLNAIELVKDTHFDLILMDVQLPGIDGNDTTREIRKFNRDIPIIAQTANAMADDKSKSIQAGCNYYLAKPIDGNVLIETVKSYLFD